MSLKGRRGEFPAGDGVDHATALGAANQALGGRASRATNRFASVELRGVDELGRTGRESRNPDDDAGGGLPSGAWELAAMVSVAVVTLVIVVTLWIKF
jgi:hypothetical protein